MINFVEKLQKEIRRKIEQIEAEDKNILKKSLDASRVLGGGNIALPLLLAGHTLFLHISLLAEGIKASRASIRRLGSLG